MNNRLRPVPCNPIEVWHTEHAYFKRLLDKLHNDRVGLIIFAGRAYLQVPLTVDYASMRMMLQNARPDQVPTQGTVIGEAIGLAKKSFSQ